MEAAPRVELGITILQTVALATWLCRPGILLQKPNYVEDGALCQPGQPSRPQLKTIHAPGKTIRELPARSSLIELERATRLELATATLAR